MAHQPQQGKILREGESGCRDTCLVQHKHITSQASHHPHVSLALTRPKHETRESQNFPLAGDTKASEQQARVHIENCNRMKVHQPIYPRLSCEQHLKEWARGSELKKRISNSNNISKSGREIPHCSIEHSDCGHEHILVTTNRQVVPGIHFSSQLSRRKRSLSRAKG